MRMTKRVSRINLLPLMIGMQQLLSHLTTTNIRTWTSSSKWFLNSAVSYTAICPR